MSTVQETMKEYRKKHGYSIEVMSRKSGASPSLLRLLERGNVTHPVIAQQVGKAYELTTDEIYMLMPAIHRPNDPNYNPGKYKPIEDQSENNTWIFVPQTMDEAEIYFAEHQKQMQREHKKRGVY